MNRRATPEHRKNLPSIEATLDLTDEGQRRLHDFIRRMHTGRWPTLRALGMGQIGGKLYEAAEWIRTAEPRFGLIEWRADGNGMSMRPAASRREALAELRHLLMGSQKTHLPERQDPRRAGSR